MYESGYAHETIRQYTEALGLGAYSPRKFLETRFSEVASQAIWDKSRALLATYIASNFGLSMYAFAKPTDSKLNERRY